LELTVEGMKLHEVFMPALGMASTDVYLAEWSKQPGDSVAIGDTIAVVETDKAELTVDATAEGTLGSHLFPAETSVPSGATITFVLSAGEIEPSPAGGNPPQARAVEPPLLFEKPEAEASEAPGAPGAPILVSSQRQRDASTDELEPYTLSPRARAAALEQRSVTETPAQSPASQTPVASPQAQAPESVDRYRAAVSAAVSRSWSEIPHFSVTQEIRVEKLLDVLNSFRAISSDVTLTDVFLKAYALSLIDRLGTTDINLGLAVATDRGVAMPVLRSVATRDLLSIAAARRAAVDRARDSRQDADDQIVPHSSVSNLGSYGIQSFTGIVPFGQTSLLTIGAAADRAVVEGGRLEVGKTAHLTLNVDHRSWDGQHAADVLRRFTAIASAPALLLAIS
jgi:pyruvate dehydrogenase E2 component (dihydrolipoamide acetyltransferase)